MAAHDVSKKVDALLESGYTYDELNAILTERSNRIGTLCERDKTANNRRQEGIINSLPLKGQVYQRPATHKQLAYITALGGTAPEGMSLEAASELIDQLKTARSYNPELAAARREAEYLGIPNGDIWDD